MHKLIRLLLLPAVAPGNQSSSQAKRTDSVDQILVRVASPRLIADATRQITALLRERHRIRKGEPEDFNIRDMLGAPRRGSTER